MYPSTQDQPDVSQPNEATSKFCVLYVVVSFLCDESDEDVLYY